MADIAIERESNAIEPGWDGGSAARRLSWGAIFAGFFVAIGVHLVLALLGIAIGLSSWSPTTLDGPGAGSIATGVGIWTAISALIALFVGGATTGHLAGYLTPKDGFLHGAILWSLVTVAMIWLVMSGMGFLLGGAFDIVGRTASATISAAGSAATEIAPAMIQLGDAQERGAIADEIAQRSGLGVDSVREILSAAEQRAQQVRTSASQQLDQRVASGQAQVRAVAEDVSDTTARGAWWTLLALGLSLGAAGAGAASTARR